MLCNARNEKFEIVEIDGVEVLFTSLRLDRNTIPDGLFCYDVRETEGFSGVAATLEPLVAVNHLGTVVSKQPFPMDGGFYEVKGDDISYLGASIGIEEFMQAA